MEQTLMQCKLRVTFVVFGIFVPLVAGGCNSMHVTRVKNGSAPDSLHAIAMNPSTNFGFVARDVLHYGKAYGSSSVADEFAAVASGESTTQVVSKQLSETFDQPTTQSLAQFHAAYLGLVADVTNEDNQKRYWDEIAAIRCEATAVRKEVLARTEYYLALRAISAVERLREEQSYLMRRIAVLRRDSSIMSDLLARDRAREAMERRAKAESGGWRFFIAKLLDSKADPDSSGSSADGKPLADSKAGSKEKPPEYVAVPMTPMSMEEAFELPNMQLGALTAEAVSETGSAYQWRLVQLSPEIRGPWPYREDEWRQAQFRNAASELFAAQHSLAEVLERLCRAYEREDNLTDHIVSAARRGSQLVDELSDALGENADINRAEVPLLLDSKHAHCPKCTYLRKQRNNQVEPVKLEKKADLAEPAADIVASATHMDSSK